MYEVRLYFKGVAKSSTVYFEGPIAAEKFAVQMSASPAVACAIVQDIEGLHDPAVFEDGGQVD